MAGCGTGAVGDGASRQKPREAPHAVPDINRLRQSECKGAALGDAGAAAMTAEQGTGSGYWSRCRCGRPIAANRPAACRFRAESSFPRRKPVSHSRHKSLLRNAFHHHCREVRSRHSICMKFHHRYDRCQPQAKTRNLPSLPGNAVQPDVPEGILSPGDAKSCPRPAALR